VVHGELAVALRMHTPNLRTVTPEFRPPQTKTFPIDHRVELCRRLHDYALEALGGAKDGDRPGEKMIVSNWARATGTFDSVLRLAADSYGDQVTMLSRSLFEVMLDCYWISIKPLEAQRLATLHHYHQQLLITPAWNEHELLPGDPELRVTAEALKARDETTRLFGAHGQKHWTTLDMWRRILAVDQAVPQDEPGQLKARYQIGNQMANVVMHGSGTAINDRVGADQIVAPGVLKTTVVVGPTTTYLTEGLRHAFWSYQRICVLVASRRAPEAVDKFDAIYARAWPKLRTVTVPALKRAGRNGPCPCGSSEKTKDCHGAL